MNYNETLSKCYQIVINTKSTITLDGLVGMVYGEPIQPQRFWKFEIESEVLSVLKLKDKKRMIKKSLFIIAASTLIGGLGSSFAQAADSDYYKLYAHSRILNDVQYKCFTRIIYKESRWNHLAKNGSHFGLGQMRSQHYRNLDPYRQIDQTLKYIAHRYGSSCNAWRFHQKNNYF